jgi:hypothetical protein
MPREPRVILLKDEVQPERETTLSRTACPDIPRSYPKTTLSKANRLAVFYYFSLHYNLREAQRQYVAHFQARLNLDQVQKALKFAHRLTTDPRLRARLGLTDRRIDGELTPLINGRPIPSGMRRLKLREQRRIGVGYRDKGSLPGRSLSWDKDNTLQTGESTALVTAHWDLTLFYDPPSDLETEADKVVSERRNRLLEELFLNGGRPLRLSNPEQGVWCISAPPRPSGESS